MAGRSGAYTWGQWGFAGGGRLEIPRAARRRRSSCTASSPRTVPACTTSRSSLPTLQQACDRAIAHGYRIVGFDDSDPSWAEAFLHPKEALGIVVQIVESRASDDARRPWPAPAGPASPPPPVTTGRAPAARPLGRERADTQWSRILLGARDAATDGTLVYRWPGSPMRVAVDIDPAAEEGPVAIEYVSDRPVTLAAARRIRCWAPRSAGCAS